MNISAGAGYHFVSYNHYPTYYSPFHDYYPISLGLHLGLHSHYGDGYGYHDHHHYHHHHTYTDSTNNGVTSTNKAAVSNNNPNNVQSNQNGSDYLHKPSEPYTPLVYTIPAQSKTDDVDSTEILFSNPYLIVGVENLLFYGEIHDEADIIIVIDQSSDGLKSKLAQNMYNQQSLDINMTISSTTEANLFTNVINSNNTNLQNILSTIAPSLNTEIISTSTSATIFKSTVIPLAPFPNELNDEHKQNKKQ